MKKLPQILLLSLFCFHFASAQSLTPQVIASAGNFATNSGYSLSYTMGEPVVPTFTASGSILTQGFQQDYLSTPTAVQQVSYPDISVSIYPNPAANYVNVLVTSDKSTSNLSIRLFDLLGRSVNVPVANHSDGTQKLFTLNLSNLAATVYFITVYDMSNNTTHTFKINKINL
jgi:hypothetical protein